MKKSIYNIRVTIILIAAALAIFSMTSCGPTMSNEPLIVEKYTVDDEGLPKLVTVDTLDVHLLYKRKAFRMILKD